MYGHGEEYFLIFHNFFSGVVTYRKWKVLFILGLVNSDGGVMMERNTRTGREEKKCYFGLTKHLSSKLLSRKLNASFIKHQSYQGLYMARRLGLWDNMVNPLTGKFYGKYLAW